MSSTDNTMTSKWDDFKNQVILYNINVKLLLKSRNIFRWCILQQIIHAVKTNKLNHFPRFIFKMKLKYYEKKFRILTGQIFQKLSIQNLRSKYYSNVPKAIVDRWRQ